MSISPEQLPQPPDSTASDSGQPNDVPAVNPPAAPSPATPSVSGDAESTGSSAEASSAPSGESPSPPPAAPRLEPIPPPSEPMQYRAIGLVRGRYMPSANQFTQGILLSSDGTVIDAVLLGRIMSLVKNHLSLEQEHLWVVYPRTRQKDGNLHTQIVGVWEPETLSPDEAEGAADLSAPIDDGYFSIRGEVVYQSQEQEYIVVKIRQAPRKPTDTPKFFKLKLKGTLPGKAVGNFWDMQVQRQAENLVIQQSADIGPVPGSKPKRKPGKPRKGGRPPSGGKGPRGAKPYPRKGPPAAPGAPGEAGAPAAPAGPPAPPKRKEPIAKPVIKRRPPNPESEEGGKGKGEG